MEKVRPALIPVALVLTVAVAYLTAQVTGSASGARAGLTQAQRAGPLRFAPDVAPADQQAVLAAITLARPEARRLIDIVDGAVTVEVAPTGATTAGSTTPGPDGYEIVLDLGTVSRSLGARGIARLVLHELGHVVDFALVPEDLKHSLDAGIPQGYGCEDGGQSGSCAVREERFAESFAKWATGDIGVNLSIGYRVPPTPSLDAWGLPLTGLR